MAFRKVYVRFFFDFWTLIFLYIFKFFFIFFGLLFVDCLLFYFIDWFFFYFVLCCDFTLFRQMCVLVFVNSRVWRFDFVHRWWAWGFSFHNWTFQMKGFFGSFIVSLWLRLVFIFIYIEENILVIATLCSIVAAISEAEFIWTIEYATISCRYWKKMDCFSTV